MRSSWLNWKQNKPILGGVCYEIAFALDVNPLWVRLLTVGLAAITGVLGLTSVYVAFWLLSRSRDEDRDNADSE